MSRIEFILSFCLVRARPSDHHHRARIVHEGKLDVKLFNFLFQSRVKVGIGGEGEARKEIEEESKRCLLILHSSPLPS